MDRIIVYASYDQSEYVNYYHLIHNDETLIEYCSEEKIDDLFRKINFIISDVKSSEIYIVQDKNASEWDYQKMFRTYNLVLHALDDKDIMLLCNIMNSVFRTEYRVDDVCETERLRVLFYGNIVSKNDCCKTDEMLRQAEEILKHGGEEMSELARIIKEKYERMSRHE